MNVCVFCGSEDDVKTMLCPDCEIAVRIMKKYDLFDPTASSPAEFMAVKKFVEQQMRKDSVPMRYAALMLVAVKSKMGGGNEM
jgi:hypothetical protein